MRQYCVIKLSLLRGCVCQQKSERFGSEPWVHFLTWPAAFYIYPIYIYMYIYFSMTISDLDNSVQMLTGTLALACCCREPLWNSPQSRSVQLFCLLRPFVTVKMAERCKETSEWVMEGTQRARDAAEVRKHNHLVNVFAWITSVWNDSERECCLGTVGTPYGYQVHEKRQCRTKNNAIRE